MKQWTENILIGFDQFVNTWMGGDPDETISSTLGKLKRRHGGKIPFKKHWFAFIVDWGLDKIDPNHSIDAIEEDEGQYDVRRHKHDDDS